MTTDEMREPATVGASDDDRSAATSGQEAYRLLATMVLGAAAALPEAWRSYQNVDEARGATREIMRNHRVLRVALVEDRIPLRFVERVGR